MHAITFLVILAVLFVLGGSTFVRKFLRGFFRGVDLYVLLTVVGKPSPTRIPGARSGWTTRRSR